MTKFTYFQLQNFLSLVATNFLLVSSSFSHLIIYALGTNSVYVQKKNYDKFSLENELNFLLNNITTWSYFRMRLVQRTHFTRFPRVKYNSIILE